MKKQTAAAAAPSNKEVLNDEYKIDTYGVKQYEEKRVVSKVTLLEPKGRNKYVLCHVESLRADCLVPVKDLLPINEDKEVLNITPGNWCMSKYPPCDFGIYSDKGSGRDIALVRGQHDNEEANANAALIAAAPELYKVLEKMIEFAKIVERHTEHKCHELAAAETALNNAKK